MSYICLEFVLIEGYLYYLCFKLRSGFSIEDYEKYGFEVNNMFKFYWFVVKCEYLFVNFNGEVE